MLTPTPETPKKNELLVRQEAADKSKQQANELGRRRASHTDECPLSGESGG
jgi:hypothetical protein